MPILLTSCARRSPLSKAQTSGQQMVNKTPMQWPLGRPRGLFLYLKLVGRMGIEPMTPGLKDVGYTCCSMPPDMESEHPVRQAGPDL